MEPRRKSIRLKGWDYSEPGAYFVTICPADARPSSAGWWMGKWY